jgi:hypothetical protein
VTNGGSGRARDAWLGAAIFALLAGCAERPVAAPPAVPPPRAPQVVLPPPPPPPRAAADWRDLPPTPGDWSYAADSGGSKAEYGAPGMAPVFVVRCDGAARQVRLSRSDTPGPFAVRTSYGVRTIEGGSLAASDPLLDQIAFSRGRFTIEAEGRPTLVIPTWPEPARVAEDCRG